jgi:hypothetical protein
MACVYVGGGWNLQLLACDARSSVPMKRVAVLLGQMLHVLLALASLQLLCACCCGVAVV